MLASLALACARPSPAPQTAAGKPTAAPPPALHDDLPRLATRMAQMYRDWKQAFDAAGTDCGAATTRMNTLVDANADLFAASQRVQRAGHDKVKAFREARVPHDAEIDANAKAIFESKTLAACKEDAAFSRALERLGGER